MGIMKTSQKFVLYFSAICVILSVVSLFLMVFSSLIYSGNHEGGEKFMHVSGFLGILFVAAAFSIYIINCPFCKKKDV